jgi:hypothetical protein
MAHLLLDDAAGGAKPVEVGSERPRTAEPAAWRKSAMRALKLFAAGVATTVVTIGVAYGLEWWPGSRGSDAVGVTLVPAVGFGIATVLFGIGVGYAVFALIRIARADDPGRARLGLAVALLPMLTGALFTLMGAFFTAWAITGFARGRQLRRRGKLLLPPIAPGDAWCREDLAVSVPADLRAALAAQWRQNGRTEHASVAAFARLTLDLVALGAPVELIEAANRDAMDEIRHADLCFSIARALDGRGESPGPFPAAQHAGGLPRSRPLALAQLAVTSLVDGTLHEGLSARVIARLAKRCEEPTIRAALRELAADEGRHAAHGWEVVEWCLAEGRTRVAHALRGASSSIPSRVESDLPAEARAGRWETFGIHGSALEAEEYAKARAEVVRRVRAMTDDAAQRAA